MKIIFIALVISLCSCIFTVEPEPTPCAYQCVNYYYSYGFDECCIDYYCNEECIFYYY